jgi:uncharacterized protein (DUF1778 family)
MTFESLTERHQFRLSPDNKKLIKSAARILGCSPSEFSRNAVLNRAQRIVRHNTTRTQKSASKAA